MCGSSLLTLSGTSIYQAELNYRMISSAPCTNCYVQTAEPKKENTTNSLPEQVLLSFLLVYPLFLLVILGGHGLTPPHID